MNKSSTRTVVCFVVHLAIVIVGGNCRGTDPAMAVENTKASTVVIDANPRAATEVSTNTDDATGRRNPEAHGSEVFLPVSGTQGDDQAIDLRFLDSIRVTAVKLHLDSLTRVRGRLIIAVTVDGKAFHSGNPLPKVDFGGLERPGGPHLAIRMDDWCSGTTKPNKGTPITTLIDVLSTPGVHHLSIHTSTRALGMDTPPVIGMLVSNLRAKRISGAGCGFNHGTYVAENAIVWPCNDGAQPARHVRFSTH